MTDTGRKRPLLAVVLAFIFPGLGHFYLRKWVRGLLWLGLLFMLSVVFVVTGAIDPVTQLSLRLSRRRISPDPRDDNVGRDYEAERLESTRWATNENQTSPVTR